MAPRCLRSRDLRLPSLLALRVAQSRIKRNSVPVHVELSHATLERQNSRQAGTDRCAPQMRVNRKKREVQRALTVTGSIVNPDELPLITMLPAAPVDRTIASTLPLNAFLLVPLY